MDVGRMSPKNRPVKNISQMRRLRALGRMGWMGRILWPPSARILFAAPPSQNQILITRTRRAYSNFPAELPEGVARSRGRRTKPWISKQRKVPSPSTRQCRL